MLNDFICQVEIQVVPQVEVVGEEVIYLPKTEKEEDKILIVADNHQSEGTILSFISYHNYMNNHRQHNTQSGDTSESQSKTRSKTGQSGTGSSYSRQEQETDFDQGVGSGSNM